MSGDSTRRQEARMIDHAAVNVRDIDAAKRFYSQALEPLGISMALDMDDFAGFASEKGFHFGIFRREPAGGAHVAFACENWGKVDAFYEAAIAAGGKDNGSPGLRPHYHENYYGAYVRDADGNNIEAVCQTPQS
jgi:catechol 2,3-dioxygenase-like lactoylglutathione lyase family enzyme